MAKGKEPSTRYRFAVPDKDESVIEWLEAQMNLSVSLRFLIKEDIVRNGCTDVTCRSVEQLPKRGRPTNAELERRQQAAQPERTAVAKPDTEPVKKAVETAPRRAAPERKAQAAQAQEAHAEPVEEPVAPATRGEAEERPMTAQEAHAEPEQAPVVLTHSQESMITNMFSGGGLKKGAKTPSAAAMGLLDDDE